MIKTEFKIFLAFRYTKQGNLKYHTDCAPNNGYYFIPIYDKGEYVIKVNSSDKPIMSEREIEIIDYPFLISVNFS